MPQCQATTKRGARCHANARAGQPWCHMHRFDGRAAPSAAAPAASGRESALAEPPALRARPSVPATDLRFFLLLAAAVALGTVLGILVSRFVVASRSGSRRA